MLVPLGNLLGHEPVAFRGAVGADPYKTKPNRTGFIHHLFIMYCEAETGDLLSGQLADLTEAS